MWETLQQDGLPAATCKNQAKLTQYFIAPAVSPSLLERTNAAMAEKPFGKSPTSGRKRKLPKDDSSSSGKKMYQPVIDADQRRIGPQLCPVCKFCGDFDDENDKKLHDENHLRFLKELVEGESSEFNCKSGIYNAEQVVCRLPAGLDVVAVRGGPTAKNALAKKACAVLSVVEGYMDKTVSEGLSSITDVVFLLFHVRKKKIIGCLFAQQINQIQEKNAFFQFKNKNIFSQNCKINSNKLNNLNNLNKLNKVGSFLSCGISLLWVAPPYRRKGTATALVDCFRKKYSALCYGYGQHLPKASLAFAEPTKAGLDFIASYMSDTSGSSDKLGSSDTSDSSDKTDSSDKIDTSGKAD